MIPNPPHIDTDPSPGRSNPHYRYPAQAPLASNKTVSPGIQFSQGYRRFSLHLWNCWGGALTVNNRFGFHGVFVLLLGILQLLSHRWGRTALMALYLYLLLAAPYYAARLRIRHRGARFVRGLFFHVYGFPDDPASVRILPRTFPLMFIPISSVVLLFWP